MVGLLGAASLQARLAKVQVGLCHHAVSSSSIAAVQEEATKANQTLSMGAMGVSMASMARKAGAQQQRKSRDQHEEDDEAVKEKKGGGSPGRVYEKLVRKGVLSVWD